MSFNWSEYLLVAQQLAGKYNISATQEYRLGSAISRAYYAAFIQDWNFLKSREGVVIPTLSTHQFVIRQFSNSPDAMRQEIKSNLKLMGYYRNQADYDDSLDQLPRKARATLKLSAKVIQDLQNL